MCSGNLHFNRISWDCVAEFGGLLTKHMVFYLQDSRMPLGWEAGTRVLLLSGW